MISFLCLLKELLLETGLALPPLPRVKAPVALETSAPIMSDSMASSVYHRIFTYRLIGKK